MYSTLFVIKFNESRLSPIKRKLWSGMMKRTKSAICFKQLTHINYTDTENLKYQRAIMQILRESWCLYMKIRKKFMSDNRGMFHNDKS